MDAIVTYLFQEIMEDAPLDAKDRGIHLQKPSEYEYS